MIAGARAAAAVGVASLLVAALGAWRAPATFPHAWLAAFSLWLEWPLGCLGLLLIHSLTGGRWGERLRPALVAGLRPLWLLPLAALPWLLGLHALYPWTDPAMANALPNHVWLNVPFLLARAVLDALLWGGIALLTWRALADEAPQARLARIAPAALIVLALSISFAVVDLILSLDPRFYSTVFGLLEMSAMVLLAFTIALLRTAIRSAAPELEGLGQLLLALLLLWAYLDFVQLLIVWQSNLPEEAAWYGPRLRGNWGAIARIIAGAHFILPFMALLSGRLRRSRIGLITVAGVLILAEILRAWWLVLPAARTGLSITDIAAMLGLLALSAAIAWQEPGTLGVQPAGRTSHA